MTNDNEYTPSTHEVREGYAQGLATRWSPFNRWLAEFERKVAERSWDECLTEIEQNELNTDQAREDNPYRGAPEQEGSPRLSSGHPDYWCHVCNRGLEGCEHLFAPTERETP